MACASFASSSTAGPSPLLLPSAAVPETSAPADGRPRACRRHLWDFLSSDPSSPRVLRRISIGYHCIVTTLIVALFACDSKRMNAEQQEVFRIIELSSAVFFSLEYILRIYACVEQDVPLSPRRRSRRPPTKCELRIRTACSIAMILDLLSLLSMVLDLLISSASFRGLLSLRIVRLFNILRVERSFKIFRPVMRVVWKKRNELIATMGLAGLLLLVSAATMYYLESSENEQFSSMLISMWWATTALTTIGYGDIVPITPGGRVCGCIVGFVGVALFALPAGIVSAGFQDMVNDNSPDSRRGNSSTSFYSEPSSPTGTPPSKPQKEEDRSADKVDALRAEMGARLDALQSELADLRSGQNQILMVLQALQESAAVSVQPGAMMGIAA